MLEPAITPHTKAFLKGLPRPVAARVRSLLRLQAEQLDLVKKHQEAKARLEAEQHRQQVHYYEERAGIINSKRGTIKIRTDNEPLNSAAVHVAPGGGIPDFWLQALKNNPVTEEVVTDADEAALKYLRDIQVRHDDDDPCSFRLEFEFDGNPFFDGGVLTKTFRYERDPEDYSGDLVYGEAVGGRIAWREGWDLKRMVVVDKDGKERKFTPVLFSRYSRPPPRKAVRVWLRRRVC